ncbi:MAG: hypothetical protein FWD50_05360 [Betaproteobacteria bacterium]|nr:hypothetical protein [Betaproteobacteria bacterium]
MHKNIVLLVVFGSVALAACGNKTDANEKNFGAALTQYFDKKGDLCLNERWPVDVDISAMALIIEKSAEKHFGSSSGKRMAALEAVGLVKSEDVAKAKIKRYTLTDAAKPFVQEKEVDSFGLSGNTKTKQTDLCWGKKALDKVVKWEGPMKFGDYQEAGVTYTYKINSLADWAKSPEVQAAFPSVKSILDGAGKREEEHAVKLTSQGWEAKGLDRAW